MNGSPPWRAAFIPRKPAVLQLLKDNQRPGATDPAGGDPYGWTMNQELGPGFFDPRKRTHR